MRLIAWLCALVPNLVVGQGHAGPVRVLVGGDDSRGAALGTVQQVVVVRTGIVVLENAAPYLRYFALDGRLRQTLGRQGAGPGEYRSPTSLVVDSTQRLLWVVDPQNARLTRYQLGDTLALDQGFPVDVPMIRAACIRNGRLFALPALDSALIRELTIERGRLVGGLRLGRKRSAHPLAAHPLLRMRMGDGPLVCTPSTQRLQVASSDLGEVLSVPLDPAKDVTLLPVPGAQLMAMTAEGRALRFSQPTAKYYERIEGLRDEPMGLTVDLARRELDGRAEITTGYRQVTLRADGSVASSVTSTWRPVGFAVGRAVCFRSDPVPTIGDVAGGRCP